MFQTKMTHSFFDLIRKKIRKWGKVVTPSGPPPETLMKEGSSRGALHRVASLKTWSEVVALSGSPHEALYDCHACSRH